jgi:hypothetical protein
MLFLRVALADEAARKGDGRIILKAPCRIPGTPYLLPAAFLFVRSVLEAQNQRITHGVPGSRAGEIDNQHLFPLDPSETVQDDFL